ncbi:triose-phosphate isomerase [Altererythrobacter sp. ZODW24]|uniref:triose-phosphate isomerase n=1 Tax=Altererythrobacter sp. ZODW24 TaxID=2185142 RepID=UPI000DF86A7B|nr:triose-phosphate isomerase [Altererythrobacter sp. ZODW24]
MAQRPYIVGNWKMNGTRAMLSEARAIDRASQRLMKVEVAVAPPFTLIHATRKEAQQMAIGAQDCHAGSEGAHTGDVSASMVADAGASFVILGHSERRQNHTETDEMVKAKADSAIEAGLKVIVCCGETEADRDAGKAIDVVTSQLRGSLPVGGDVAERLTVAYEPVWAIGTGRVAADSDVAEMHAAIRALLLELYGEPEEDSEVRILYGGSVKPENAAQILSIADVGGALVGGASLTAESFLGIVMGATEAEEAAA